MRRMRPKRWDRGRRGSTDHATIGGEIAVGVGRRRGGGMTMMRGARDDTDIDDCGRGHEMTRGNLVDTGTDRAHRLETGGAEKTVDIGVGSESMMASTSSETEAVRDTETGGDGMARKAGGVLREREWERGTGRGTGRGRGRGSAVHHHTPDGGGTIRGEVMTWARRDSSVLGSYHAHQRLLSSTGLDWTALAGSRWP